MMRKIADRFKFSELKTGNKGDCAEYTIVFAFLAVSGRGRWPFGSASVPEIEPFFDRTAPCWPASPYSSV